MGPSKFSILGSDEIADPAVIIAAGVPKVLKEGLNVCFVNDREVGWSKRHMLFVICQRQKKSGLRGLRLVKKSLSPLTPAVNPASKTLATRNMYTFIRFIKGVRCALQHLEIGVGAVHDLKPYSTSGDSVRSDTTCTATAAHPVAATAKPFVSTITHN